MKILRSVGVWAGGMALLLGSHGWSQTPPGCISPSCNAAASGQKSGTGQGTSIQPTLPTIPSAADTPQNPDMDRDQSKMRNLERQKQLVSDTEKLLALANELKADMDKSTKDTMSLDVIKKADEIEKLAHSVKEKMKRN
jgi:hypothetical protein